MRRVLSRVQAALLEGETRATCWYDKVNIYEFTGDMIFEADQRGGAFINVNTPEELASIERRILAGEMTKMSDTTE